jgi:hypothetical protein
MAGCSSEGPVEPAPRHPVLIATAAEKEVVLDRLDREPYATILATIEAIAAEPYEEPTPAPWDHRTIGHNNTTAQANALIAWLKDDEAAAQKARELLLAMPSDFETNNTWDVNIRMPHVLMTACFAWDLLRGTPWLSDEESAQIAETVTTITSQFFDRYLVNGVTRQLVLGVSQNNHPIRTASAIGMVAVTFPDHPEAEVWGNWAVSELSYLLGPEGRYIQADGGVSEGPFYYGFAYGPAIAFAIAMKNAVPVDHRWQRDCRNRQDADPWLVTDCVDGEPFVFPNPLDDERFHATVDWSINLRLPTGWRAPLADANYIAHNGSALLTSFGGAPHHRWDFEVTPEDPRRLMTWGMDLTAHHLFYVDESVEPAEPPWRNRFLPEAGNAVFRSGWDEDARWLLLVAENGAARKTLHDHVDGTSFTLAAYGEYLLLDPGYYKPDNLDNAVTADADSHNVILVDGQGAPDKGLLLDFGDADAFLENTVDGEQLAYAEAHQSYESTDIERGIAFVRKRYFVVADRLRTSTTTARTHAWRLGGYAGYDVPGTFEPWGCGTGEPCGAKWEKERAGVDVHLASTAPGLTVVEPSYEPLAAPHVGAFNRPRDVEDHGVIDGIVEAVAPGYLAVLAPYAVSGSGDDAPLAVTPLEAGQDAAAFLVEGAEGREVAWLRGPDAPEGLTVDGTTVTSDAAFVIAALDGAFGMVARGTMLEVDGEALVNGNDEPMKVVE